MLRRATALVYVADLEAPVLTAGDAHHLLSSLRLRPGELVVAADGMGAYRGCELPAEMERLGRRASRPGRPGRDGSPVRPVRPGAVGRDDSGRPDQRGGASGSEGAGLPLDVATPIRRVEKMAPAVTIGVSLAKGERTEWAVAKLVELGVDRIVPLVCDRTIARPAAGRSERLQRIVRESAMQARRLYLPEVDEPSPPAVVAGRLAVAGGGGVALAEPGGGGLSLGCPVVLVGPEGGWSAAERSLGLPEVGFGETVLRIETAAVVAGALLVALRSGRVRPAEDVEQV